MDAPTANRRRLRMWDLSNTGSRENHTAAKFSDFGQGAIGHDAASVMDHLAASDPERSLQDKIAADGEDSIDVLTAASAELLRQGPQSIELDGFCELPNGLDRSCRTKTIGPQAVDIVYQDNLDGTDKRRNWPANFVNDTIHLDLAHVGKFHGVLTEHTAEGFQVAIDTKFSGLILTKLARYMAYDLPIQQKLGNGLAAHTQGQRIVPKCSFCTYRDAQGILYKGSIVSVSPLDAMVKTRMLPEINSMITFCGRRQRKAHVIRRLESGFAALFVDPLGELEFSSELRLTDEFQDFI